MDRQAGNAIEKMIISGQMIIKIPIDRTSECSFLWGIVTKELNRNLN